MKEPKKTTTWIFRYDTWIASQPSSKGVWRMKKGGFLIRTRVTDPRTGKKKEIKRKLQGVRSVFIAHQTLKEEKEKVRLGLSGEKSTKALFSDYSVSLLERKVATGKIKSAKSRERWCGTLHNILIPRFGPCPMDAIRRADILNWVADLAKLVQAGKYKPSTANGWLAILRVIITAYVFEEELERNPVLGIEDFDTSEYQTYTEEEPNSLLPDEVPPFLEAVLLESPQHFAMVALSIATGLRPSSLRPMRWRGPKSDVLWDEGVILIRRSHTMRREVMETTKTSMHQRLKLPDELMDILDWHVGQLRGRRSESDLLFPPRCGDGFMTGSALAKPFAKATARMRKDGVFTKTITPRGTRRTFQDMAREANVKDIVTRAISGHATDNMQRHYSTVNANEIQAGIGKVISLSKAKELLDRRSERQSGAWSGASAISKEKRSSGAESK